MFIIWDQISGTTKQTHVNDLKLANWNAPKVKEPDKSFRKTRWVEPPLSRGYTLYHRLG